MDYPLLSSSVDPLGPHVKEEDIESDLSTRGVVRPAAEDRRQQDRLADLESENESDIEPDVTPNVVPNVPKSITHTHDNDSSSDEGD